MIVSISSWEDDRYNELFNIFLLHPTSVLDSRREVRKSGKKKKRKIGWIELEAWVPSDDVMWCLSKPHSRRQLRPLSECLKEKLQICHVCGGWKNKLSRIEWEKLNEVRVVMLRPSFCSFCRLMTRRMKTVRVKKWWCGTVNECRPWGLEFPFHLGRWCVSVWRANELLSPA